MPIRPVRGALLLTCLSNVPIDPITGRPLSPLWAEAAQMREILDNLPGVVFAADREGRIELHRGLAAPNMGLQPKELIGRSAFEVFDKSPSILDGLRRALAGERVTNQSEVAGRIMEASLEPVRGPDGLIVGLVGVGVDVTDRRSAEEAHRRTNEMLQAVTQCSPTGIVIRGNARPVQIFPLIFGDLGIQSQIQ